MIYLAKGDLIAPLSVNLIYNDGVIAIPFIADSRTYRGLPAQLFKNRGFPLKAISSFLLAPGTQKIMDVGISFDLPPELYGHIVSPQHTSRYEPLIAPGIILPIGSQAI